MKLHDFDWNVPETIAVDSITGRGITVHGGAFKRISYLDDDRPYYEPYTITPHDMTTDTWSQKPAARVVGANLYVYPLPSDPSFWYLAEELAKKTADIVIRYILSGTEHLAARTQAACALINAQQVMRDMDLKYIVDPVNYVVDTPRHVAAHQVCVCHCARWEALPRRTREAILDKYAAVYVTDETKDKRGNELGDTDEAKA